MLSKQVEDSLRASQEHLRDALAFAARTEKPYVSKHIASFLADIDNLIDAYDIIENMTIQHYKPGEGFYKWHTENTGYSYNLNRHLVFMTYLNDVENGGTEFYHFPDLKIQARKGLTLIWPAGWTHTHKGVISNVDEKYIITGWYSFYDK